ncbi:hypothetical protein KIPB_007109, partial [Kipferlia bialata]|eukprot:g7109.t1
MAQREPKPPTRPSGAAQPSPAPESPSSARIRDIRRRGYTKPRQGPPPGPPPGYGSPPGHEGGPISPLSPNSPDYGLSVSNRRHGSPQGSPPGGVSHGGFPLDLKGHGMGMKGHAMVGSPRGGPASTPRDVESPRGSYLLRKPDPKKSRGKGRPVTEYMEPSRRRRVRPGSHRLMISPVASYNEPVVKEVGPAAPYRAQIPSLQSSPEKVPGMIALNTGMLPASNYGDRAHIASARGRLNHTKRGRSRSNGPASARRNPLPRRNRNTTGGEDPLKGPAVV